MIIIIQLIVYNPRFKVLKYEYNLIIIIIINKRYNNDLVKKKINNNYNNAF
jgi:hypothetical protein